MISSWSQLFCHKNQITVVREGFAYCLLSALVVRIDLKQRCLVFQKFLATKPVMGQCQCLMLSLLYCIYITVSLICYILAMWPGMYMWMPDILWANMQHISFCDIFQNHHCLNYCMTSCVYPPTTPNANSVCVGMAEEHSENMEQGTGTSLHAEMGCSWLRMHRHLSTS